MELSETLAGLAEKATPGEWEATERSGYHEVLAHDPACDWYGRQQRHAIFYGDTEIDEAENVANAALIVTLRNNLPTILAALRTPASAPDREANGPAAATCVRLLNALHTARLKPNPLHESMTIIATALSAAEQRGFERAREMAAKVAKTGWVSADYNVVGIEEVDMAMAFCEHIESAIRAINPERTEP